MINSNPLSSGRSKFTVGLLDNVVGGNNMRLSH